MVQLMLKLTLWLFLILGAYLVFNLNWFHREKPMPASKLAELTTHLQIDPLQYVAKQFEHRQIVLLGELHKRKQDLDFLASLIPYLYKTQGITVFGWEFGAAVFQREVDSLMTAPQFDRHKCIAVMRQTYYSWCYEEYLHIFEVIWSLNLQIPAQSKKIRFLQLNKIYEPRTWESSDPNVRRASRNVNFDNLMPEILERELLHTNQKALIYCGLHHAFTRFQTPKFLFLKDHYGRAGQRLYSKCPEQVFQIALVSMWPPRWLVWDEWLHLDPTFVFPFDGLFNQLYDSVKHPFAVDSKDPAFHAIKDYRSFYSFDRFSGVSLPEICDGYIMLDDFFHIQPVHVIADWINNPEELNEVRKVLPDSIFNRIKSTADFWNFIRPDAELQAIKEMHQKQKFW